MPLSPAKSRHEGNWLHFTHQSGGKPVIHHPAGGGPIKFKYHRGSGGRRGGRGIASCE